MTTINDYEIICGGISQHRQAQVADLAALCPRVCFFFSRGGYISNCVVCLFVCLSDISNNNDIEFPWNLIDGISDYLGNDHNHDSGFSADLGGTG